MRRSLVTNVLKNSMAPSRAGHLARGERFLHRALVTFPSGRCLVKSMIENGSPADQPATARQAVAGLETSAPGVSR